jgi:DNA-binding NarL/FixJ family response regulator
VILSLHGSRAFVAQALQNGATGYVLKDSTEKDLSHAVREAAAGRRFLSPPVSDTAINAYIELSKTSSFDPHDTLTPRQREVLQLTAEGKTNAEMAARLNISQRTVENHRAVLMQKLGLQSQTELIRHALRHGLIAADE